jgi:two-component system, OmpR family, phosphate regulon sensor histidine kinase PhoR
LKKLLRPKLKTSWLSIRSLRVRLVVLMSFGATFLLGFLIFSNSIFIDQNTKILQDRLEEYQHIYDISIDSKGALPRSAAIDYSYWDDMVDFVSMSNQEFIDGTLVPMLSTFRANFVEIYAPDKTKVYTNNNLMLSEQELGQYIRHQDFNRLFSSGYLAHFYANTPAGIFEIFGATIVPGEDINHTTPPKGYMFVGQLLDSKYIDSLAKDLSSEVSLILPSNTDNFPLEFEPSTGSFAFKRDILDLNKKLIAQIYVKSTTDGVRQMSKSQSLLAVVNTGSYFFLIIGLMTVLWLWVLRPLDVIYDSLSTKRTEKLNKLIAQNNEFSGVSELLIQNFEFEHALMLEKESVEQKVKQRTMELMQEQARLKASIDSLDSGFMITFMDLTPALFNPALTRLFNLSTRVSSESSDIISEVDDAPSPRPLADVVSTDVLIDRLQEKIGPQFDLGAAVKDCTSNGKSFQANNLEVEGKYLNIRGTAVIQKLTGKTIGSVVLVEDTTAARLLERTRDEFSSITSHELRTPLTVIRGNASTLKLVYGDKLPEESVGMLNDMQIAAERMIELVNQMFSMSNLEQSDTKLDIKLQPVAEVIDKVIEKFSKSARDQGITLSYEGRATQAYFDSNYLFEAIGSVVDNATKYSKGDSISISVIEDGSLASILISDNGVGIDVANQPLLFRKFQQATDNILTRDNSQSAGLSLYIAKLAMKKMGGDIELVKSVQGEGTTFKLSLKLKK